MNNHSIPTRDNRGEEVSYWASDHEKKKKKKQTSTQELDFHVHNLIVLKENILRLRRFFPFIKHQRHSLRCS